VSWELDYLVNARRMEEMLRRADRERLAREARRRRHDDIVFEVEFVDRCEDSAAGGERVA
jgi:hypothetical protein